VVGTILSPLKISDKPRALEEPSTAADGNDQEDYMCPVTPPTVKSKPGQFSTSRPIMKSFAQKCF